MTLSYLDYSLIGLFFLLILVVSLRYTQKSNRNLEQFFLGGRNLPWWLAGTSMVATTFAADTPLLITELVAQNGISGNWIWWNGMIGGMLTVFFFARYWRKAGTLTDVEFITLRYAGKKATYLRYFRALYLGIFLNAIVMAWVNVALMSILEVFFELSKTEAFIWTGAAMAFVVLYSALSGLRGVVVTDAIQFVIAMIGCTILAYLVVSSEGIGGMSGLIAKLPTSSLAFFPTLDFSEPTQIASQTAEVLTISAVTFFSYVFVQWWASWYPGSEPGGGGYVVQRMMSAKNEKHAFGATLFFQLAHFGLRPWVWILVGLAATILYPDLPAADKKLGYVYAMRDFLPSGLKGLLLAAFFAAYMSTISTQLNWGASYLVNDFLVPIFYDKKKAQNAETGFNLVRLSQICILVLMGVGLWATAQLSTLKAAFEFLVTAGAGLGAVLILRWYWWRISVWSEILATLAPLLVFGLIKFVPIETPNDFLVITFTSTAIWLIGTLLLPAEPLPILQKFYRHIEPQGFWKPVRKSLALPKPPNQLPLLGLGWILGVLMGYSFVFGIGYFLFQNFAAAALSFSIFLATIWGIQRIFAHLFKEKNT
ncbi:sodium:solute symporter family protein [Hugenholtzia roseola]|uniref:sodium:solute symporter family protein n=1 Tax=Hugenholtzia roseola TaxID=1002 RepID=UPI0004008C5C|nr:sodium:solute symporter family protein [Hugenholtzia roseola]